MSGPFYQYSSYKPSSPRQQTNYGDDLKDWGQGAPESVGKQARKKQRVQLEKKALNQAVDNDPDDWFGNYRKRPTLPAKNIPTAPRNFTFAKSTQTTLTPGPSLLARLSDTYHPVAKEQEARHSESRSSSYHNQRSRRNRDHDRGKGKNQHEAAGSRYKGGYR